MVAPEIVLNGKNINLSAFKEDAPLPAPGASTKEIVLDSDFTPDTTATLAGHDPQPGRRREGERPGRAHARRLPPGSWVEVNLKGFRMTY